MKIEALIEEQNQLLEQQATVISGIEHVGEQVYCDLLIAQNKLIKEQNALLLRAKNGS